MRALCLVAPLLAVSLAESETSQPPKDAADPLAGITDPQSLSQLLQWSLAHQDLDTLHERAEAMRRASGDAAETAPPISGSGGGGLPNPSYSANAAIDAVKPMSAERRAELDALAQTLSPDMVAMMRESLERSLDASLADEEREESLLNLQDLVEDIDNARDFKSIGGFVDVLGLLASEVPTLQAGAAWVVGSAVKNHHELQLHLLAQNALPSLLALLRSHADANVRAKALYALSSLVRNCPEAQAAFGTADGVGALLGVLSAGRRMHRVCAVRWPSASSSRMMLTRRRRPCLLWSSSSALGSLLTIALPAAPWRTSSHLSKPTASDAKALFCARGPQQREASTATTATTTSVHPVRARSSCRPPPSLSTTSAASQTAAREKSVALPLLRGMQGGSPDPTRPRSVL
jgi:hypothetical protein